jgi:phosphoenolpyruvate synthase/pyruvate phosphate dikinase
MQIASLDSVFCQDARLAGLKAVHLAHARTLGFPVPDSVVVLCSASEAVLKSAAHILASSGLQAARLTVMEADRSPFVTLTQAVAHMGEQLAVRASSPLPANGGRLASYLGVSLTELPTAVLNVWKSALGAPATGQISERPYAALFGADIDGPARQGDTSSDAPLIGVIVQRDLQPAFRGSASVIDGEVRIVAQIRQESGGQRGPTFRMRPAFSEQDEYVEGRAAANILGTDLVAEVRALAHGVCEALGDAHVDWAYADDEIWLLQSREQGPAATGTGQGGAAGQPDFS